VPTARVGGDLKQLGVRGGGGSTWPKKSGQFGKRRHLGCKANAKSTGPCDEFEITTKENYEKAGSEWRRRKKWRKKTGNKERLTKGRRPNPARKKTKGE